MRKLFALGLLAMIPALAARGADDKWVTVKGRIVWDTAKGTPPARQPVKATKDEEVCAKDKDFNTEDWVVNTKSGGIRNVVVWLAPEPAGDKAAALQKAQADNKTFVFASFKAADIHPDAKPAKNEVEIDQPCCRFIPHVVVAQAGQDMVIKNSASVPHNAKWVSRENGEINPLLPAGGQHVVKGLKGERFPIEISCSIHPWMKAWVRVFDHPYFAVTDEDGNFEIKNAPVLDGKLRMFIWQENGMSGGKAGRFGQTLEVKPGTLDLKEIKFKVGD
jgi:plastocyanin